MLGVRLTQHAVAAPPPPAPPATGKWAGQHEHACATLGDCMPHGSKALTRAITGALHFAQWMHLCPAAGGATIARCTSPTQQRTFYAAAHQLTSTPDGAAAKQPPAPTGRSAFVIGLSLAVYGSHTSDQFAAKRFNPASSRMALRSFFRPADPDLTHILQVICWPYFMTGGE